MIPAAVHSTGQALFVIGVVVVIGLVVAAGVAFWRGLIVPGIALAVLAVIAAVLLL